LELPELDRKSSSARVSTLSPSLALLRLDVEPSLKLDSDQESKFPFALESSVRLLSEPNHTPPSALELVLFDHASVFASEPESFWLDHDIISFSLCAYAHTALSIHE
jgi:hypothetical protein